MVGQYNNFKKQEEEKEEKAKYWEFA